MNESEAVKLYKKLEEQWLEVAKDFDVDSTEIKEIDHRMDVVWKLLTEEERKQFLLAAKKELMSKFTQSFEATWGEKHIPSTTELDDPNYNWEQKPDEDLL